MSGNSSTSSYSCTGTGVLLSTVVSTDVGGEVDLTGLVYLPLYFDMKMFIKLAVKIPAAKHSIAVHKTAIAVVTLFVPMERE